MSEVHVYAFDTAKRRFQVCGADRGGDGSVQRVGFALLTPANALCAAALHCCDGSLRDESLPGDAWRMIVDARCV